MGNNPKLCDLKSLLVICDSKTHMFYRYWFFVFYASFFCIQFVWFAFSFMGLNIFIIPSEFHFWFGCVTPFKVFMCCVLCVLITLVVSMDIGEHENYIGFNLMAFIQFYMCTLYLKSCVEML